MTAPAQLPKLNRAEKAGIITGITVTASAALGFGYTAPLIAQNLERMTQSGALLGWLISIAAITTILVTPIVPKLLSRFPARLVLIIALLIWCSVACRMARRRKSSRHCRRI